MPGRPRGDTREDIFESSLNLEGSHYQEGFDEGFADGIQAGREEGREVGLKTGFQVGEELGFYTGCVDLWSATLDIDASVFSARARRSIKQLEELLSAYPLSDPEDERVTELLDKIRLKFQAILSMLSLQLDYPGHPKHGPTTSQRVGTVPTVIVQAQPPPPAQVREEAVTLVLRPRKQVSWRDGTVDNEHLQKKSSKICCVYHKNEELEDYSDEEDDTEQKKNACQHGHSHCHDGAGPSGTQGEKSESDGGRDSRASGKRPVEE
ncbi:hypothetical protein R1sor_008020 [Riccia sorocarpa]|uniref:Essential protein Yae1 N-terminal domain-containing protein n=1 Tax=Riccia sorocarpa TaxID=122646 RepID=A0ABD3HYG2_9MARC